MSHFNLSHCTTDGIAYITPAILHPHDLQLNVSYAVHHLPVVLILGTDTI